MNYNERPWQERLSEKIGDPDVNGCRPWKAFRNPLGYGMFRKAKSESMWLAHRAAWVMAYGPIPDGLQVCHKCDNPPCCNPDHMFIGTNSDNVSDKMRKGRWRGWATGARSFMATASEETKRQIAQKANATKARRAWLMEDCQ